MRELTRLSAEELHRRRERAIDRMRLAWIAALASNALRAMVVVVGLVPDGEWRAAASEVLSIAVTCALGYATYFRRSRLAAGTLLVLYAGTVLGDWLTGGFPAELLTRLAVIFCYVQGLRGAIGFAELRDGRPAVDRAE